MAYSSIGLIGEVMSSMKRGSTFLKVDPKDFFERTLFGVSISCYLYYSTTGGTGKNIGSIFTVSLLLITCDSS